MKPTASQVTRRGPQNVYTLQRKEFSGILSVRKLTSVKLCYRGYFSKVIFKDNPLLKLTVTKGIFNVDLLLKCVIYVNQGHFQN
jgi:hypothetical protein